MRTSFNITFWYDKVLEIYLSKMFQYATFRFEAKNNDNPMYLLLQKTSYINKYIVFFFAITYKIIFKIEKYVYLNYPTHNTAVRKN